MVQAALVAVGVVVVKVEAVASVFLPAAKAPMVKAAGLETWEEWEVSVVWRARQVMAFRLQPAVLRVLPIMPSPAGQFFWLRMLQAAWAVAAEVVVRGVPPGLEATVAEDL